MANRRGRSGSSDRLYFLGLQNYCSCWLEPWNKRCLLLGRKAMTNVDSILKSRDIILPIKVHTASYGFLSSHVWMWKLDHTEVWALKNGYFQVVVLEKILENRLDSKEIKSVNPKGTQPWIFTGRTDTEDEAPILWLPDAKRQLTGKHPNAGKNWRQKEKRVAENNMIR